MKPEPVTGRWTKLNQFVDHQLPLLPRGAGAAVWLALFRHANREHQVSIGAGRLADLLAVDRRTAQRAVQDLVDAGFVKVVRRGGLRGGPNVYQL
jgi:DNA-binding MarR family transcriptional regulator